MLFRSVMPEAGAVKEYKGYLYMGGDVVSHIGKYKLADENYNVKKQDNKIVTKTA